MEGREGQCGHAFPILFHSYQLRESGLEGLKIIAGQGSRGAISVNLKGILTMNRGQSRTAIPQDRATKSPSALSSNPRSKPNNDYCSQLAKLLEYAETAGKLTHQLNNLLQAIVAYGDILLNNLSTSTTSTTALKAILKAATDAGVLGQDLLALSRETFADINENKRAMREPK